MPKRKAGAISQPTHSGSQADGQPDEEQSDEVMDVQRQGEAQADDAAAACQPCASAEPGASASQSASPAAAAVAVTPFDRLATVELQLIMRCCDQPTLIALARCSRFTLAAASSPFVWQPLSPIEQHCGWRLQLSSRLSNSLLRHADISVTWRLRSKTAVSADQVAALAALPRLRGLVVQSSPDPAEHDSAQLINEGTARLFQALAKQIDSGGALTSLSFDCRGLRQAGESALATFIAHSRTLTTLKITHFDSSPKLTGTLPSLADALAQCRTLTSLEVESQSVGRDAFRALAAVVQHSASLTTFKLRGLNCDAEGAAALAAAVKQSLSLTDLQLPSCKIGDADMGTLVAAVEKSSSSICRLDVSLNQLGNVGAAALARLLASDRCALTALDVSGNMIGSEGAVTLSAALQTNRTLTELRLGYNGIGYQSATAVISALRKNPHCRLRVLALNGCSIGQSDAAALATAMQRSSALERLEVSRCSLTDEGMATLADGIRHSRTLRHLDVSRNSFGAAGAAALAAAVGACPALTSLNVSYNSIGDAGLSTLTPALVHVRSLQINDCGLTSQSGELLPWLVQHSRALQSLSADSNQLGARGFAAVAAALQPSSSLRNLRLRAGCRVDVDGAAALADALRRGWPASELHLGWDLIVDDIGAHALAAALEQLGDRCTLATLSLSDCGLTAAGALALVRAATATPRLRSLELRLNISRMYAHKKKLIAACGPQPHFELNLDFYY